MAHYFEIKTEREIRNEFRAVRKNKFAMLLPLARMINEDRYDTAGLEFFIQDNKVSPKVFAGEVLRMEDSRIAKQNKETKLIWIQQGVASSSGYYKRVKRKAV